MKKTFWNLGIATIVILTAMLVGRAQSSGSPAATQSKPAAETGVKIDNFTFTPTSITVPVGSTVLWTNHDDIPHTVVSEDKSFKSKALDTDDKFSFTFTKPGTYTYYCSIHPKMTGKIIVQ
ncbi:MAG TPA: cupredoxin family copper-binding protein [Candidatus Angelobacter sp.]|nr:cupredoxin family copper-binding protein [Candidatus Angelobacter sp.]